MTDLNDPARVKTSRKYWLMASTYSDKNSSVKLYSTNLVTTAKAGQALPFRMLKSSRTTIEKMNPSSLITGWDAKVEEIEDPEIFEKPKKPIC